MHPTGIILSIYYFISQLISTIDKIYEIKTEFIVRQYLKWYNIEDIFIFLLKLRI
ncbi:hypothetical protein GCM10008905_31950 [Clostridium malenominatum]|uniref:Uncharacterized protein n=1 Tax=Clostridium malenominatum TaxID=1539 RepID=A0ABP3UCW0_9CLOT